MTSEHSMRNDTAEQPFIRTLTPWFVQIVAAMVLLSGCLGRERLHPPRPLTAPFRQIEVWGVAPFTNESGLSEANGARVADHFTTEVEQIDGIRAVPVNRVMTAMNALGLNAIESEAEAMALLRTLDIDGIVVGTVTAYDPYPPLKLGLAVQLIRRPADEHDPDFDPRELVRNPRDSDAAADSAEPGPVVASGMFDASNHAIREAMHAYTRGRAVPKSAFGERVFEVSMERFTQFVSYELVQDLLSEHRARLTPAETTSKR